MLRKSRRNYAIAQKESISVSDTVLLSLEGIQIDSNPDSDDSKINWSATVEEMRVSSDIGTSEDVVTVETH